MIVAVCLIDLRPVRDEIFSEEMNDDIIKSLQVRYRIARVFSHLRVALLFLNVSKKLFLGVGINHLKIQPPPRRKL